MDIITIVGIIEWFWETNEVNRVDRVEFLLQDLNYNASLVFVKDSRVVVVVIFRYFIHAVTISVQVVMENGVNWPS